MARPTRHRGSRRVRETPASEYTAPNAGPLTGVLYDSDVIIEILRGRDRFVDDARSLERQGTPTFCTAIAWAEIYAGIRHGEESLTAAFFESRGEIAIDAAIGRRAGYYLNQFGRSHGVELADALVAAAATSAGLSLWTLNRKHYPMPGVRFYAGPIGR